MTDVTINETGCVITRSDVTGDILCRAPGADCDCLMTRHDGVYSTYEGTYGKPVKLAITAPAWMLETIAGYPDKSRKVAELYAALADGENGLQESDIRWIAALCEAVLDEIKAERRAERDRYPSAFAELQAERYAEGQ